MKSRDAVDLSSSLAARGCRQFEAAISQFIEGVLPALEHEKIVVHLETCEACGQFALSLRDLTEIHRESEEFQAALESVDPRQEFVHLAKRLFEENLEKLAAVCYELGKAYLLASSSPKGVRLVGQKPRPIGRLAEKGGRLFRESVHLAARSGGTARTMKVPHTLFRARSVTKAPTLDTSRRYLIACLRLNPRHWEARLYLGHYFRLIERLDKAKIEFRKVYRLSDQPRLRLMALTKLGLTYAYERRYEKAVECFEAVWKHKLAQTDPQLGLSSVTNLAIFSAKADHYEDSMRYFGDLVNSYSGKLSEIRGYLRKQTGFIDLMRRRSSFKAQLKGRYPVLFAS